MGLVIVLLFAAILGIIPAMIAGQKGHEPFPWWIFGTLLFILALPAALLIEDKHKRRCPECREWIMMDARKCPFCGTSLLMHTKQRTEEATEDLSEEVIANSVFTYRCSSCGTFQRSNLVKCQKCGADNPHQVSAKKAQDF